MYPIFNNSTNTGHNTDSFQDNLINICNAHRNQDRAIAFAFILYDFTNPQISKVLQDEDYWSALHEISGNHLTVFSIHKSPKSRLEHSEVEPKHSMEYMTSFSLNQKPNRTTDQIINRYFEATFKVQYPALLFFQVDEMQVVDAVLIGLTEEKLEDSFLEIKSYIKSAVEALAKIAPENKNNFQEIFNQLEGNVRQTKTGKVIRKLGGRGFSILGIVSSAAGMV